jgi:hypothetical protein
MKMVCSFRRTPFFVYLPDCETLAKESERNSQNVILMKLACSHRLPTARESEQNSQNRSTKRGNFDEVCLISMRQP